MTAYDAAWYAFVEAEHEIQNPVSPDAIRQMGRELGLGRHSWVLDVGCGTCGPAIVLAQEFGCHLLCVDVTPVFLDIAAERIAAAGVGELIQLREQDAAGMRLGAIRWHWNAALCLGAGFVFGGLVGTLEQLSNAAPRIAVGEPYVDLAKTTALAESAGVRVEATIASAEEDWDTYEGRCWRTLGRVLEHADEGRAEELRRRERQAVERRRREKRGWAIFVCRVIT